MAGKTAKATILCAAISMMGTGCATKNKQYITNLRNSNARLTEQLNRAQNSLGSADRENGDLNERYLAAMRDIDELRAELANMPEPTTAAPGWTPVAGGAMIAIETGVLYPPGKAKLRQDARRTLDTVVSAVRGEYSDKAIFVIGHTDNQPIRKSGWSDNWQLSSERSLAVVRYLEKQGVSPSRLTACGAGEFRPIVDNASSQDRKTNRRVEIFAVDNQILGS